WLGTGQTGGSFASSRSAARTRRGAAAGPSARGERAFRKRRRVGTVGAVRSQRRGLRALPSPVSARPPRGMLMPRIVAAAVAVAGLVTLSSAAFSVLRGRIELLSNAIPLAVRIDAASVAAMAGFGLLVIAGALARRQRRAWAVATVLLLVAGVSHLIKDVDVLAAGRNLGVGCVLLVTRREFDAKAGPGSTRRAVLTLPLLAATVWAFGFTAIVAHLDAALHASVGSAALGSLRGLL